MFRSHGSATFPIWWVAQCAARPTLANKYFSNRNLSLWQRHAARCAKHMPYEWHVFLCIIPSYCHFFYFHSKHFPSFSAVGRAPSKWNASELSEIEILRSMRVNVRRRRRWRRTLYGWNITLAITVCPKFYSSVHLKFKRRLILFVSLLSSAIGMAWCRTAYSQCTSETLLNKTFFSVRSFVPSFASCGKIYAQTTERNQSKYYLRINWEQKAICPWTAFIAGVRSVCLGTA